MNQPDADGELPAVSLTLERVGQHDFNEMPRILPYPAHAETAQNPATGVERPGDQGGCIPHRDQEERGDEQVRMLVEGAVARIKRFGLEPVGLFFQIIEKVAKLLRRIHQNLLVLLHAGFDEPVGVFRAVHSERVDGGVGERIVDGCLFDILFGEFRVYLAGSFITFSVGRWY